MSIRAEIRYPLFILTGWVSRCMRFQPPDLSVKRTCLMRVLPLLHRLTCASMLPFYEIVSSFDGGCYKSKHAHCAAFLHFVVNSQSLSNQSFRLFGVGRPKYVFGRTNDAGLQVIISRSFDHIPNRCSSCLGWIWPGYAEKEKEREEFERLVECECRLV